jgi:hypothetical protein
VPPSLRFATITSHDGIKMPAMIAAVQRPRDGEIVAVQRTVLTWSGNKAPVTKPRTNLGTLGLGVLRLDKATEALGLAEGREKRSLQCSCSGSPAGHRSEPAECPRSGFPTPCENLNSIQK